MRLGKFFKNHLASPKTFIFSTISIEAIAGGLLLPVLPYLVEQFRSDAFTIGLLSSSFASAQFIATLVLGAVSDRIGRRPILLICTAGTSLAFYIFGFANALWLLFLSRIFNQIIAPSIAGFSYDQLGMEVPFWGAALSVLLAIVTIWPNRGAMKSASH